MHTLLKMQLSIATLNSVKRKDYINSTFKFNKIRVKLIKYKLIFKVVLINASKTISKQNILYAFNYLNIVRFDNNNSNTSYQLLIKAKQDKTNPKE